MIEEFFGGKIAPIELFDASASANPILPVSAFERRGAANGNGIRPDLQDSHTGLWKHGC
ncbi:hypothetical protein [Rubinisphaera brasiliensis]|uniref:hypothetical protein n=1 Tax=Rubinisphaera brasiliensis TaxID=119 RepID=UPI00145E4D96|nr:hypothetical protein [Rubinisphaera brasiliensis]